MPNPVNIEELKKHLSNIVVNLDLFKQYTAILQNARPTDRVIMRGLFLKSFWFCYQNKAIEAPELILNEALHAMLDHGISKLGGSLIDQLKLQAQKDTDLATHTYFLLGLLILGDKKSTAQDKKMAEKLLLAYEAVYLAHGAYIQFMRNNYLFIDEVVVQKAKTQPALTTSAVALTTRVVVTPTVVTMPADKPTLDAVPANQPTAEELSADIPLIEIKLINTAAILNAFNGKADTYIRDVKNRNEIHHLLGEAIKGELPHQDVALSTSKLLAHPENKAALQRIFKTVRMNIRQSSPQIEMTEFAACRFIALVDFEYEIWGELNPLLQILAAKIEKVISADSVGRVQLMAALTVAARKLMPFDMPDEKAPVVFAHPENIEAFKILILSNISFIQEYSALNKLKKIKASDDLKKIVENSIPCFLVIDDFQNFCLGSSTNEAEKIFLKVRDLIEKFTEDRPLWTLHEKKQFKSKTIQDQRAKFLAERLKEFDRDFPTLKEKEEAHKQLSSILDRGQYTFNAGTRRVVFELEFTGVAKKLIIDLAKQMQHMLNVVPEPQKQPLFFRRLLEELQLSYPVLLPYFDAIENKTFAQVLPKNSVESKAVFHALSRALIAMFLKINKLKDVDTEIIGDKVAVYYAEVMTLDYRLFGQANPLLEALLKLSAPQLQDVPATCAYLYKQMHEGDMLRTGFDYIDVRILTTHASWFTSVYAEGHSFVKPMQQHQYIIDNNQLLLTRINEFTDYYAKLHPLPTACVVDAYKNTVTPASTTRAADVMLSSPTSVMQLT